MLLLIGTKEHCFSSLDLIEKINSNFTQESEDESNPSPNLLVIENEDDVNGSDSDQGGLESESLPPSPVNPPKFQQKSTVVSKKASSSNLSGVKHTPARVASMSSVNINSISECFCLFFLM